MSKEILRFLAVSDVLMFTVKMHSQWNDYPRRIGKNADTLQVFSWILCEEQIPFQASTTFYLSGK